MAKLINGDGNKAIWAAQDADLIAALTGNVTGIAKVGNKFAATQEDANTIGLSDGVIITKEGRRIQLDVGNVDLFDIPTGTAGVTSYYIIGYHLITNSDSSQTCETFVQKMDNATDVITENTFRGGATEVYVSCYRIVQDGLNIDSINALLPELENISTLMSALDKGSVSVSANGVKTYSQLFNELFALIDISKLTRHSVLALEETNGTKSYYGLYKFSATEINFSESSLERTTQLFIRRLTLKTSASEFIQCGGLNPPVIINYSSGTPSNVNFVLYY